MLESRSINTANNVAVTRKRVGVITMYRKNYGAFLQSYALQRTLEKCGYDAELIRYDYYNDHAFLGVSIGCLFKSPILFIKKLLLVLLRYRKNKIRDNIFKCSINNHLKESTIEYKHSQELYKNPPIYDVYLTGSDQVFNPNLTPIANGVRLLEFTDAKKVSYAASAGTIAFNKVQEDRLVKALERFTSISVREDSLLNFLAKKGFVNIHKHIDPTLLLEQKEWAQFAKIPACVKENNYIFYYYVADDSTMKSDAMLLSESLNLPILMGDGKRDFPNQILKKQPLSPEEWVGAIANADYVVTNSFHGAVFSILFHKKVYIKLCSHPERLTNLLQSFGLERLLEKTLIDDSEIEKTYKKFDDSIIEERTKSIKYLTSL